MKNLFKQSLISLVTGLLFVAGVVFGSFLWDSFIPSPEARDSERISNPPNINIIDHRIVHGSPRLKIEGNLVNNSQYTYEKLRVEVSVSIDSFQVNRCVASKGKITNLKPGETRKFEVECSNTAGSGIPENLNYDIAINSGRRFTNN